MPESSNFLPAPTITVAVPESNYFAQILKKYKQFLCLNYMLVAVPNSNNYIVASGCGCAKFQTVVVVVPSSNLLIAFAPLPACYCLTHHPRRGHPHLFIIPSVHCFGSPFHYHWSFFVQDIVVHSKQPEAALGRIEKRTPQSQSSIQANTHLLNAL